MEALIERHTEGSKIVCTYRSANVSKTEYDPDKMILEISFINGAKYRYHAITVMEHAGMLIAESAGQYVHKNFKGKRYEKITAPTVSYKSKKPKKGYIL